MKQALHRRGSLSLWIEDAALECWQTCGPSGQARFKDAAIQTSGVVQNPTFLGYTGRAETAGLRGPDFGRKGVLCGRRRAASSQVRWG